MKADYVRYRNALCLWLGAAAFCILSLNANARGYAPAFVPNATGVAVATKANAQAVAVLNKVGNNVNATSSVIANIAKGVTVEAVVTAGISGAATAGAWGAAYAVLGTVAIAALPHVKDWMDSAGVKVKSDGSFEGPDPTVCTVAPCYSYNFRGSTRSSPAAACAAGAANGSSESFAWSVTGFTETSCSVHIEDLRGYGAHQDITLGMSRAAVPPVSTAPMTPLSFDQAQARLAATPPTPGAVQDLVDAGFAPETVPVTITGPATAGELNTTKLGLDGAQQTETCKFYLEYFPSNIKAHPECSTTTVTPSKTETKQVTTTNTDGTTTTQTVITTTPGNTTTVVTTKDKLDKDDQDECTGHPERVGCIDIDLPGDKIPKQTRELTYTPQNLGFGGGSCPANIVRTIHGTALTLFDYTRPCALVTDYLKPLILALSAWICFIILMPGAKTE